MDQSSETSGGASPEWGRRVRAAAVLRGWELDALAVELNVSRRTLNRMIDGTRRPRPWEVARINKLLELPEWFLSEGLDGRPTSGSEVTAEASVLATLDRIERSLREVRAALVATASL